MKVCMWIYRGPQQEMTASCLFIYGIICYIDQQMDIYQKIEKYEGIEEKGEEKRRRKKEEKKKKGRYS